MKTLTAGLAVSYPVFAHVAALRASELLTVVSLELLVAALLLPRLVQCRTSAWTAAIATAGDPMLFVLPSTMSLALAPSASPDGVLLWLGAQPPATAPRESWPPFANLLNYLIVGAFFTLKYAGRRYRFPQQPFGNMFDFIRTTTASGPWTFGTRGPA